ncbi:MAG: SpoIID/LytB domain-containing protein [Desulfobacterota bacterium]|nr:SpoIID/LytB domain-containing protein [Thermodesulfobacteriota bacterium]
MIRLAGTRGSLFTLERVTLGSQFHWERKEDLTFPGDLLLHLREDGTICAINEVDLEGYLAGVVSSEMNPEAPMEFLKAHAILSRSWLLAGLGRKGRSDIPIEGEKGKDEILRYYGRSEHDLYDVCSEDHCQRYQGVTKIAPRVGEAIEQTRGGVMVFGEEICDARYSKACGGITEIYPTAWEDRSIPYLRSISDGPSPFPPLLGEKEVEAWIRSRPEAYCNVEDEELLGKVLTETDLKTRDFFRWRVEYPREELEEILKIKSGIDFGALKEIVPLRRGPSGRISRLKIAGTKRTFVVGKELEIRRWLSRSHLYSSAFVVRKEADRFILLGAGWGHGVGLCQIGAAAMALKGCSAERILTHYFPGTDLKKIY